MGRAAGVASNHRSRGGRCLQLVTRPAAPRHGAPHKGRQMPPRQNIPYERVEQLLRQGMTQQQICQRLGINRSSVSQIATGKYRRPKKEQAK